MARPSRRMKRVSKSNGFFVLVVLFSVAVCSLILWCTCVGAGAGAAASSSRNLWVSGLSSTTRATDLKTLFSKYGKVSRLKTVSHQCRQTLTFCMDATGNIYGLYKCPAGCRSEGGDQCQKSRGSLLWVCHHVIHRGSNQVYQPPSQDRVAWQDDLCGAGECGQKDG